MEAQWREGMGNREWGMGNGEREGGTEGREWGTGKGERGARELGGAGMGLLVGFAQSFYGDVGVYLRGG